MVPMTGAGEIERQQTLREVQGAYLAQYRANHRSNDQVPAIRLVLANPGRDSAHWRPVAEELVAMTTAEAYPLRAVTGFNISVRSSEDTIGFLTREHGIPVVAGPLTADDLANSPEEPDKFPGLAKVVPGNSAQASALGHYHQDIDPSRTLLIEDLREGDNYNETLSKVFREVTRDAPHRPETFRSRGVNEVGTLPNEFARLVSGICGSPAEVVYFAGRPTQLRVFVNALGNRHCTDRSYTVVTGSGASTLVTDPDLDWSALENRVTVRYSALAHPDAWTGQQPSATGGSAEALGLLTELIAEAGETGATDLTDSRTITLYDAAWTAITGIRGSAVDGAPVPDLDTVADSWLRMHGINRVDGVSGWICLDNHGLPYNKAVAIVELDPTAQGLRFAGTAWPAGSEPEAECLVPNTA